MKIQLFTVSFWIQNVISVNVRSRRTFKAEMLLYLKYPPTAFLMHLNPEMLFPTTCQQFLNIAETPNLHQLFSYISPVSFQTNTKHLPPDESHTQRTMKDSPSMLRRTNSTSRTASKSRNHSHCHQETWHAFSFRNHAALFILHPISSEIIMTRSSTDITLLFLEHKTLYEPMQTSLMQFCKWKVHGEL